MQVEHYRNQIEHHLRFFIEQMGEKNTLRDACEYALLNGGKRLRPILVLLIAEELKKGKNVIDAAMSVEFFHTASLIADDLPCMDDDSERRNRPSLHTVFGESVAILASYALIAEGYGGIYRNGSNDSKSALICLEAATRCAGINGATNGQFLDLFPPNNDLETIRKIIYQKTVTLFEISFIFGWLFGGGDPNLLEEVKKSAYHLGMAFQIADDLLDENNIAICLGKEKAQDLFECEIKALISQLQKIGLWSDSFKEVVAWLKNYAPTRVSSLALPEVLA